MSGVVERDEGNVSGALTSALGPSGDLSVRAGKVVDGRDQVIGLELGLELVGNAGASNEVDH